MGLRAGQKDLAVGDMKLKIWDPMLMVKLLKYMTFTPNAASQMDAFATKTDIFHTHTTSQMRDSHCTLIMAM